nr:Chain A, UGTX [Urticina]
ISIDPPCRFCYHRDGSGNCVYDAYGCGAV